MLYGFRRRPGVSSEKQSLPTVQKLVTEMGMVGIDLHPQKCKSIIIMSDGNRKTTDVDTSQRILVGQTAMPNRY